MRQPKSQVLPTIVARPTFPGENKMMAVSEAGNETTQTAEVNRMILRIGNVKMASL